MALPKSLSIRPAAYVLQRGVSPYARRRGRSEGSSSRSWVPLVAGSPRSMGHRLGGPLGLDLALALAVGHSTDRTPRETGEPWAGQYRPPPARRQHHQLDCGGPRPRTRQLRNRAGEGTLLVGLGVASIVLAWSVVHTVYTLRYAKLYYEGTPKASNSTKQRCPTSPTSPTWP